MNHKIPIIGSIMLAGGIMLSNCGKKEEKPRVDIEQIVQKCQEPDAIKDPRIFTVFEGLYKKITDENKPDNVGLLVLPYDEYVEMYRAIHKKNPGIELETDKSYSGAIEFTTGNLLGHQIVVLDNVEDFLFEAISHGIGHAKYAIEYYKLNPTKHFNQTTDKVVRETAAHIAVQRALNRSNPKEYIKTRYYYKTAWFGDSQDRPGAEYTAKLVEKYGVEEAWEKILNIKRERELKKTLKKPL